MKPLTITLGAMGLTLVGCVQMLGDLFDTPALKVVGAASHASPAPRVFTAHQGFETFSSRFYVHWQSAGESQSLEITPANYAGLRGPYNRRNAYGAAISYGPVLAASEHTREMFAQVSHFAVCDEAPLLTELGIDPDSIDGAIRIELVPREQRSANGDWQLEFALNCNGASTS